MEKPNCFTDRMFALGGLMLVPIIVGILQFCAWPYPKNLLALFWLGMVAYIIRLMCDLVKKHKETEKNNDTNEVKQ